MRPPQRDYPRDMSGLARHAFILWEGRAILREAVDVVSRWGFVFAKSDCFRNLSVSERIVKSRQYRRVRRDVLLI